MKNFLSHKVLLWDFDGVIMDSMPVRLQGFQQVLENYPKDEVSKLLEYHSANGGLSRYAKFRYFYENIRREEYNDNKITFLAKKFSEIMLSLLINEKLLINDSLSFIKRNYKKYDMHIVSGSDGEELRYLCKTLGISNFFNTINGSPITKIILVKQLLMNYNYNTKDVVLIGDSHNDYEAASRNGISFYGYNNIKLKNQCENYIESFFNIY